MNRDVRVVYMGTFEKFQKEVSNQIGDVRKAQDIATKKIKGLRKNMLILTIVFICSLYLIYCI